MTVNTMNSLKEVRLQVDLEEVTGQTLDRVVERQNVHSLAVLDIVAGVNVTEITELDSKVVSGD